MDVPVYLFNGFLESGKTKFIQETMEDERFASDDKVLVLVCEEGLTEYDESRFAVKNYKVVYIDDESEFKKEKLVAIDKEYSPNSVMLEYNGMWSNELLFSALPDNWLINQVMTFFDSKTFLTYNKNMRQQTFEKISITDLVVFNRFNQTMDKALFHKQVRSITRRCDILFEGTDGQVERDDIVDPLPFDFNAEVVKIAERDYAYFYRDLVEEMKKYNGKKVEFVGQAAVDKSMPANTFLIGRHIMTCCEADIKYSPLVAEYGEKVAHRQFLKIVATIKIEKNKVYRGVGPVLKVESVQEVSAPADAYVTYY